MNVKKALLCILVFSQISIFAKGQDADIPIDDVIASLEKGNVEVLNNKVTLRSIHFETGTATFLPSDKIYLDSLADYLQLIPTIRLSLEGHTDNIGQYNTNLNLSKRRAKAVKSYLVSRGLDEGQIETAGYGSQRPIDKENTEAARRTNRRVELLFKSESLGKDGNGKEADNSVIKLKNGETINADFVMFDHDGQSITYRDKSTKAVKKLRRPDVASVTTANGKVYKDADMPKPVKLSPTAAKSEPKMTETKRSNEQKNDAAKAEKGKKAKLIVKQFFSKTSIFAALGVAPLNIRAVNANLDILDFDGSTAYSSKIRFGKFPYAYAFIVGLEHEFGKFKPVAYVRGMYQYGYNSLGSYHSVLAGIGGIAGKTRQYRIGLDAGITSAFAKIDEFYAGGLLVNNTRFNNDVSIRYRNTYMTFTPNVSYELRISALNRGTFRLTAGVPISLLLSSGIQFKGESSAPGGKTTVGIGSPMIDFSVDNVKQSSYRVAGFTGGFVSLGYFFK